MRRLYCTLLAAVLLLCSLPSVAVACTLLAAALLLWRRSCCSARRDGFGSVVFGGRGSGFLLYRYIGTESRSG
jgi:hypothetical protein